MDISISVAWLCIGLAALSLFAVVNFSLLWNRRRYLIELTFAFLLVGLLFAIEASLMGSIITLAVYAAAGSMLWLLGARTRYGRLNEQFLRHSTRNSTAIFLALYILVFVYWQVGYVYIAPGVFIVAILITATCTASLFAIQTGWSLVHYSARSLEDPMVEMASHPTVTLAIPARNETHALTHCLEAALQSDYEKLEIIVLDDCSHDNTSQLIRSFAHDGVRFIQGETPANGWLGKNQACAALTKEAAGKYIIFIGVDTQLQRDTISRLVSIAEERKLSMISVLPVHREPFFELALRQLRYIWQIILPPTTDRLPVSTECILLQRSALQDIGGYASVKSQIVPEKTFARKFAAGNAYRFIMADNKLSVYFDKRWSAQTETAIRLWYPMMRQNPVNAVGLALLIILVGIGPFIALFADSLLVRTTATVVCVIYFAVYATVLSRLQPRAWWLYTMLLPLALVQETVMILLSMLRYEFSDVEWKGRNVCYPVLRNKS